MSLPTLPYGFQVEVPVSYEDAVALVREALAATWSGGPLPKPQRSEEQMVHNVKEVTDATFEQEVLKSEGPVLVDFWAPWCGPCRMVGPVLEKVADQYAGRVTVVKMNVDENQKTSITYGIRSIPTIALFSKGEVVDGVMGAAPAGHFSQMLDQHFAGATP